MASSAKTSEILDFQVFKEGQGNIVIPAGAKKVRYRLQSSESVKTAYIDIKPGMRLSYHFIHGSVSLTCHPYVTYTALGYEPLKCLLQLYYL
jgi:hypothetical protein